MLVTKSDQKILEGDGRPYFKHKVEIQLHSSNFSAEDIAENRNSLQPVKVPYLPHLLIKIIVL
jgi:hypothetical protein